MILVFDQYLDELCVYLQDKVCVRIEYQLNQTELLCEFENFVIRGYHWYCDPLFGLHARRLLHPEKVKLTSIDFGLNKLSNTE